jgi:hypothetical protein
MTPPPAARNRRPDALKFLSMDPTAAVAEAVLAGRYPTGTLGTPLLNPIGNLV